MVETLINEEALLLAKFFRAERETWIPRSGASEVEINGCEGTDT